MGTVITGVTYERAWLYPKVEGGVIVVPYDGNLTDRVREKVADAIARHLKLPPMEAARLANDARDGALRGWRVRNFRVRKVGPTGDTSYSFDGGNGYCRVDILPYVEP